MTEPATSPPQLYLGGNEVFFSFLGALLESVDRGLLTAEALDTTLRAWGASFPLRDGAEARTLGLALDWTGDALASLGLVRAFTPDEARGGAIKVLVMRCMIGRFVEAPRVRRGGDHTCPIAPLVEGVLGSMGIPARVSPSRQGMLRADECLLSIVPGEARR
jgi:hypothetical protein